MLGSNEHSGKRSTAGRGEAGMPWCMRIKVWWLGVALSRGERIRLADTWGKHKGLEAGARLAYSRNHRSQCDEDRVSEAGRRGRWDSGKPCGLCRRELWEDFSKGGQWSGFYPPATILRINCRRARREGTDQLGGCCNLPMRDDGALDQGGSISCGEE